MIVFTPSQTSPALARMLDTLHNKRFFKLIGGGSLTEADKLTDVVFAFAAAGADCIDLAPEPTVLAAVDRTLSRLSQPPPAVMVSLPLDPDPHFRKITLDEPACIRCSACLPVCPTEAITLPKLLEISQTLCYGCGRCVPTCPTDALSLLPFQVEANIEAVLSHSRVEAVEIHSRYVDPYMLDAFFIRWQSLLAGKLISLCYRPGGIPDEQQLAFYDTACRHSDLPVMLQIDGAPMSGTDDPTASIPALEAALITETLYKQAGKPLPPLTISGGINRHTAEYLQQLAYQSIAGVGMGTVARKAVWHLSGEPALNQASSLIRGFKQRQGLK